MAADRCFVCLREHRLRSLCGILLLVLLLTIPTTIQAQTPLWTGYYDTSCPNLQDTVKTALYKEMQAEWRIGASLMRMMFHDCFVQGCDASVFLDDTNHAMGEKQAKANNHSLRTQAFEAFDNIKAAVEGVCPGVVSCADILIIVARDAVVASGGPWWNVELGRRDSVGASFDLANSNIPLGFDDVSTLIWLFAKQGLDQTDLVALSGAHTFGKAQCRTFRPRLYDFQGTGSPAPTLDPAYVAALQAACPQGGPNTTVVDLDQATPTSFDNAYYSNLQQRPPHV